jgi:A/G-specific adenine glycosylase
MVENLAVPRKPNVLSSDRVPPKPRVITPAQDLLAWYDRAGRDLPWRTKGGRRAEPYHVWLSEVMLQQTTVASVKPYFAAFLARWPTVEALAAAPDKEILAAWAGLGYYARARNLIACARAVAASDGVFPDTEAGLRALPGIGDYTAAAIAAIAFNRVATVVDGNIERIVTRLFAISDPLPAAKPKVKTALTPLVPLRRPGDFAQALMDLGSGICTPKNPKCEACPLASHCAARKAGTPTAFPVKVKKAAKPIKFGTAYVVSDGAGRILLGTRPARGLLAGMSEVPNSGWDVLAPKASPPIGAPWQVLNAPVVHVFTHFELRLTVSRATLMGEPAAPPGLRWVARDALEQEPLPTLFRKVLHVAS